MVVAGCTGTLVVGCGKSGLAAAHLHARRGAVKPLWVYDSQATALDRATEQGFEAWSGDCALLDQAVWSPGIPLAHPLAQTLRSAGVPIVSEVSFAAPDLPPAIGVTGTNGKSTVCTLIRDMLVEDGVGAASAGNVGTPASDFARVEPSPELLVVELSSYQLELPLDLNLKSAVVTNLAPDHLDRYADISVYYRTKWSLLAGLPAEAFAVLPYDLAPVDRLPERGSIGARVAPDPLSEVASWDRSDALGGDVGLENLAQAVAVVRGLGAGDEAMRRVAAHFVGLPHRAQNLGAFGGLFFVDDSKATNVAAAVASMQRVQGDVVVLLGGAGKGEAYGALVACLSRPGAQAVCFGDEGQALAQAVGAPCVSDLSAAVAWAQKHAPRGATVLLAPACASFDAYTSYIERGQHFARLAQQGPGS